MVSKLLVLFLKLGATLYIVQLLIVASWHVFPIAEQRSGEKSYRLQRGYGDSWDLTPLIGLAPILGETVTLTITDEVTGLVEIENHDDVDNVYFEYREIFGRHGGNR